VDLLFDDELVPWCENEEEDEEEDNDDDKGDEEDDDDIQGFIVSKIGEGEVRDEEEEKVQECKAGEWE
jgi:hypothetical protein